MTVRRTRKTTAKAVDPSLEETLETSVESVKTPEREVEKIPQEELETFFTEPSVEEVEEAEAKLPPAPKKKKSIPITGKVFLQEEDLREWGAYRNFLYEQGIGKVRHKKI